MPYNLDSPNTISAPCTGAELPAWYDNELKGIAEPHLRELLALVHAQLGAFVRFPAKAVLLWQGCDRVPPKGQRQKYHRYPAQIKEMAQQAGVYLDGRPNGPAIAAFAMGGGDRPQRFGSSNQWSIHHLYSGKYLHPGCTNTLHAAKSGLHFTQSAGLVAVHPVADALCDEFPFFAWRLRGEAFMRFHYDPDCVFARTESDQFGFTHGAPPEVLYSSESN